MPEISAKPAVSARPANLLQPGEDLAGYQVEALVGKGGMGEVYRVRQVSMDRVVALKVLAPRMVTRDPTFADRFFAEARAAGKLNHPNIVKVHDVGSAPLHTADGGMAHYFSMEYIEGESLQTVLDREGALPESRIAGIMRGMAAAVGYAAQVGLVHRDIKPDNIMLTRDGHVKLADLGLATASQDEASHVADRDEQGRIRVMGTPLYMSPEQARGQPLDHRSDQYSLGATLFHLLTGRPPYQGPDTRAVMKMHVTAPVPDPADVVKDVSDPWAELCMRLMAKTPDQRFATPDELISTVEAAIAGVSLSRLEELKAARSRAQEGLAWHWWLFIGLGMMAVLGGLVMLTTGSRSRHAEEPAPAPVAPAADPLPTPGAAEAKPAAPAPVAKPATPAPVAKPATPAPAAKPAVPVPAPVAKPVASAPAPVAKPVAPPAKPVAPAPPADPDQAAFEEFKRRFAPLRKEFNYAEAKALAEELRGHLASEDHKAMAGDLIEMIDRAVASDAAIKAFLASRSVLIDLPVDAGKESKTLRSLEGAEVTLEGTDGTLSSISRRKLNIPWSDLLEQSLTEGKVAQPELHLAAALWFWQRPAAATMLTRAKEPRYLAVARAIDGKL